MKRPYFLTHQHFFLVGYAYYLLFPLVLGYQGVFDRVESLEVLGTYFDSNSTWWHYLGLFTLCVPFMYLLGSVQTSRGARRRATEGPRGRKGASALIPVYGLAVVAFTFQARSSLMAGYQEELDIALVGPLSTLQMLILFQYLYERAARYSTASSFGLLLFMNSLVLLSMGGRLYVLSSLIAVYFYWWNWESESRNAQLRSVSLVLLAIPALVGVGMWRVGDFNYSLFGFYVSAESVFTSISNFTLFTGGNWHLIDMPHEFLGAFLNIVPSAIWPGKAEWLAAISERGRAYESPFGAVGIIASSVSNFGFAGGLLFFFCVGLYMRAASRNRKSAAGKAHYCYLVGLLPFIFFRDPLQVQVKLVITGVILYSLTRLIQYKRNSANTFSYRMSATVQSEG